MTLGPLIGKATFKGRRLGSVSEPVPDLVSLTRSVVEIKMALETITRQRDTAQSAVTVGELTDLLAVVYDRLTELEQMIINIGEGGDGEQPDLSIYLKKEDDVLDQGYYG